MTDFGIPVIFANDVWGGMSLSEKLSIGAETALLGLLLVFFILIVLWGALELFHVLFYVLPEKRKKQQTEELPPPEVSSAPESPAEQMPDDGEVVAAITAAVAACTELEPKGFRVVSFRKVGGSRR